MVEHDIWERKEDLENAKEVIEFERKLSAEMRRQEKLDIIEERNFRREELSEKYITKNIV